MVVPAQLAAAPLYWDGTDTTADADGGAGNWNTTAGNTVWDSAPTAGTSVIWTNNSDAVFGGAAGTVTVNTAVTANSLAFTTTGYTVAGTSVLTLAGTPTIDVGSGLSATITAPLAGTVGFAKTGAGTLLFAGNGSALTAAGGVRVNGGTLAFDGNQEGNRLAAVTTVTVNSGGTFEVRGVNALPNNANSGDVVVAAGGTLRFVSGGSAATGAGGTSHAHLRNLTLNGGTLELAYSGTGLAYSGEDFQLNGAVTVGGTVASTITLGAGSPTTAQQGIGLNGNITFTVADATASAAADLTVGAELEDRDSGANGFTKAGAGTMAISFPASYTGATTVSAGTLALVGSGSIATSSGVTVAGGAVLDTTNSATGGYVVPAGKSLTAGRTSAFAADVLGTLTNNGTLNVAGTGARGTLTVSSDVTLNTGTLQVDLGPTTTAGGGANDLLTTTGGLTLSGTTTVTTPGVTAALPSGRYTLITAGSLAAGSAANLAYAGVLSPRQSAAFNTTDAPGSVFLDLTGNSANLVWTGSAGPTWDVNATASWSGSPDGRYLDLDAVTFDDTSTVGTVAVSGTVSPGPVVVNNAARAYAIGGPGVIAGANGVTKNGTGTLTLAGDNTFTGAVAVNNGVVAVATVAANGAASPLGSGTALTLGSASTAGTLRYTGAAGTTNRAVTLGTAGGIADVTTAGTALTLSGVLSGGPLTKVGPGTLLLTGANTYGATNVNVGTLQVGTAGTAGTLGTGTTTVATGATLAFSRTDNGLTVATALAGPGAVAFLGTGTINQSSYTVTGNNVGLTGTLAATGSRVSVDNTLGSRLGSAALTATGAGQFFLTGGTFANNFTVAGTGWSETLGNLGAMRIQNAVVTGNVTLAGDARITTHSGVGTISGAIGESGGARNLEIGGTSVATVLTLNGPGTYTGATAVNNATLTLNGSLATSGVTLADTSGIGGHGSIGGGLTFGTSAGGARLVADAGTAGALTVNGTLAAVGATPIAVTLNPGSFLTPGSPYTILSYGSTALTAANFALANPTGFRAATFNVGGGAVTVSLTTANLTWTGAGGTTWSAGGATTNFNDAGATPQAFFNGDGVTFDDSAGSANATVTLSGTVSPSAVTVNNSTGGVPTYTFSGTGGLGGGATLTKAGTGALVLATNNSTLTGPVVVNGGTLTVATMGNRLGAGSSARTITVNSGGTLSLTINNVFGGGGTVLASLPNVTVNAGGTLSDTNYNVLGALTLNGGTVTSNLGLAASYQGFELKGGVTTGGAALSTLTNSATAVGGYNLPGAVTFNVADAVAGSGTDLLVSAVLTNGSGDNANAVGSLVKAGPGTLQLNAANTFTGGTTVNGGTVRLQLGGGSGTVRGAVTVNAGGTLVAAATDALGFNNDATRIDTLNLVGGTFDTAVNGNQGYRTNVNLTGGTVSSTGGGRFNFTAGFGISSLAAATTSVFGGGVDVRDSSNLSITVARGTTASGVDLDFTGVIGNASGGAGAITKAGPGTLRLTAANTYGGGTTVSAGTLLAANATGSATGTGAVTVTGTGTLGGTGSIAGPLALNAGGTVSPGASVGKLTTAAQTWAGGSTYLWELANAAGGDANGAPALAGTGWDLLELGTATLTVNGTATSPVSVAITRLAGAGGLLDPAKWYTVAHAGSIVAPNVAAVASAFALPDTGGEPWELRVVNAVDIDGGTGQYLQLSTVPEPGVGGLAAAAAAVGLLRRRRRRSAAPDPVGG